MYGKNMFAYSFGLLGDLSKSSFLSTFILYTKTARD
jgi:hypothetical protein